MNKTMVMPSSKEAEVSSAGGYYHDVKSYSEIILEKAARRRLIKACKHAIDSSVGEPLLDNILGTLEENLLK